MKIVWCILKQNNSQHFKIYFYISDKFIFAQILTCMSRNVDKILENHFKEY